MEHAPITKAGITANDLDELQNQISNPRPGGNHPRKPVITNNNASTSFKDLSRRKELYAPSIADSEKSTVSRA